MSAGEFTRTFYELSSENGGGIAACRVQPETLAFQTAVAGPATLPVSARMTGSARRLGIRARRISCLWQGAAPAGYDDDSLFYLPILSPAFFALLSKGDTLSYLGATLEIVNKLPESVR